MCKELIKRRDSYILRQDDMLQWFVDNYEITQQDENSINMKQLYREYRDGSYFKELPPAARRKTNKTSFKEEILAKKMFSKIYQGDGKFKGKRGVFRGLHRKPQGDNSSDEMDEDEQ